MINNENMKYKTSFLNHLRVLKLFIFTSIIIIVYGCYQSIMFLDNHSLNVLLVIVCLNSLPVTYLHFEYLWFNFNEEIEIDPLNKNIIYTNKTSEVVKYSFDELRKIVIYMPPHFLSDRFFIRIPFDSYHYAKIHTTDGKIIIITCLMSSKVLALTDLIDNVTLEKKTRLFASILCG